MCLVLQSENRSLEEFYDEWQVVVRLIDLKE